MLSGILTQIKLFHEFEMFIKCLSVHVDNLDKIFSIEKWMFNTKHIIYPINVVYEKIN